MVGSSINNNNNNKKQKKRNIITQENIYSLLQRYSVATVLTLLKEVAQVADVKIDWNERVKKTATGISNAREYQMLWRHLAYRDNLEENLDEGAVLMDNDSDLEFELEAHPPSSSDASSEATACVKVMVASASLADVNLSSVVEAPLPINIPSGWSSPSDTETPELQEMKFTVPVLVPKQPLAAATVTSVDVPDASDIAGGTPRRKKKPWSEKEDAELLAAVQRNGEGNWANILKQDFKGDRTTSQLSQRWGIMKKQKKNSSVGAGAQLAEFDALHMAIRLALDMPKVEKSKSNYLNGRGGIIPNMITTPSNLTRPIGGEPSQGCTPSQHHHRQDSELMTSSKTRYSKSSTSPALTPDAMVKAAAVAAGARIATRSDAATLLKAAQSKNAVHIIPAGGNSVKSSGPGNVNSLPPNVHFMCNGLVNRSPSGHNNLSSNASRHSVTRQAQSQLTRPSLPTALTNPRQTANGLPELVQTSVASVSWNETNGNIQDQALQDKTDDQGHKESGLPGSETHLESQNNNVGYPKVDVTTNLTGTGSENRSDKGKDNKMNELPVEKGRENKSTALERDNVKGEENRLSELRVQEERENKSIAEKRERELEEENKMIEMPVKEERENN